MPNFRRVCVLFLLPVLLGGPVALGATPSTPPATLTDPTDYQVTERFRDRLRRAIFRVTLLGPVEDGFDPAFRPRLTGTVVFIRRDGAPPVLIGSAHLLCGGTSIVVSAGPHRASAARIRDYVDPTGEQGVVVLDLDQPDALGPLEPLPLAPAAAELTPDLTVYALDNPASGLEVLVPGGIVGPAEPPLAAYAITTIHGTGGPPLVDAAGQVRGLCLRQHTPTDPRGLVLPAARIQAALTPRPADAPPGAPQ